MQYLIKRYYTDEYGNKSCDIELYESRQDLENQCEIWGDNIEVFSIENLQKVNIKINKTTVTVK